MGGTGAPRSGKDFVLDSMFGDARTFYDPFDLMYSKQKIVDMLYNAAIFIKRW